MSPPIREHGSITISNQLYEQTLRAERAWRELEWVGFHYDQASPEQRARFDRVQEAIASREEEF